MGVHDDGGTGAAGEQSRFLARMSHELRTPMNAILGFAQLLAMGELDEGEREAVDQILRAGEAMVTLIDRVLDLSRLQQGVVAIETTDVAVQPVVLAAVRQVQPQAQRRGIAVTVVEDQAMGTAVVRADAGRLHQALTNVLSNAIKFNRSGGEVTLWCEVDLARELRVRLCVRDTGIGIAPDALARLFEPFERLSGGAGSVGIGLALTKRLVELMGGTVGVTSELDVGSVFWIELGG